MSNLEELIEKLCPDGVEYKRLGDIGRISMCKRVLKSQTNSVSGVPFYKISTFGKEADSYISEELFLDYKSRYPYPKKGDVLISASGTIGRTVIFDGKPSYFQDSNIIWVANNEEFLTNKFLYYIYQTNPWKVADGGTIQRLYNSDLEKIKLPVPPLEVQREIVRILDNFTFLTTELAAELAARQKQYEYYKEYLFENHIFDVEWKRLDELFPFIRNGFVGTIKSFFTNETDGIRYLEGTNIHDGVISDNEVLYVTKEFHKKHIKNQLKADDILMVQSGHIGECAVVGKKYEGSNCHALIIMSNGGKCLSKYYVYYFHTIKGFKSLTPAITGGTIKHVLAGKVGKIKVPVPSLEQQQRIVDILDRFDALCNDITSGLPAEIEARQKQYEYYRDKLLTFKELKKEA